MKCTNWVLNSSDTIQAEISAKIYGSVYGVNLKNQTASEKHEFINTTLENQGSYNNSTGAFSWDILINKNACDMTGFSLEDDLAQLPDLCLSEDSVKLYEVNLYENGTIQSQALSSVSISDVVMFSDNKLIFTIPEALKGKVLKLHFDMYPTTDMSKVQLKNTASLSHAGTMLTICKAEPVTADILFDTYMESYSLPTIELTKKNEKDGSVLSGAKFEIATMTDKSREWAVDSSVFCLQTETNSMGTARFVGLKWGKLYQLTEVKEPSGFELDSTKRYILYQTSPETTKDYPTGTIVVASDVCRKGIEIGNTEIATPTPTPTATTTVTSSPTPTATSMVTSSLTNTPKLTSTNTPVSSTKPSVKPTATPVSKKKKISIKKIGSKIYTGYKIKPTLKLTYKGKRLKKSKNYTVTYRNNTKPGTATAVIKGKGNYYGSTKITFKIKKRPKHYYAPGKYRLTGNLVVRQTHSSKGKIIGYLKKGEKIKVTKVYNTGDALKKYIWLRIQHKGKTAYIYAPYTR